MSNANETQIQHLVEQLYENEPLTDALGDEAATLLLTWGERQLNNLGQLHLEQAELDSAAQALQQAMRAVNRLIEQRVDLSDTEMVEQLLKLVDHVVILTLIAQKPSSGEIDHDQKTIE
jgi:hypothetical protein